MRNSRTNAWFGLGVYLVDHDGPYQAHPRLHRVTQFAFTVLSNITAELRVPRHGFVHLRPGDTMVVVNRSVASAYTRVVQVVDHADRIWDFVAREWKETATANSNIGPGEMATIRMTGFVDGLVDDPSSTPYPTFRVNDVALWRPSKRLSAPRTVLGRQPC